jgi:hypothetical protein
MFCCEYMFALAQILPNLSEQKPSSQNVCESSVTEEIVGVSWERMNPLLISLL